MAARFECTRLNLQVFVHWQSPFSFLADRTPSTWHSSCIRHWQAFSARRRLGDTHTQPGDKVRFLVSDVFLPSPGVLSAIAEDETQLEGTVLSFSDSGQKPRFFAVVEVRRTHALVVPVERMNVVKSSEGQDP